MRNQHQRRAMLACLCNQCIHHFGGGGWVQITSGLVGQQQARAVYQCARYSHALQLAATQLLRQARAHAAKADRLKHGLDAGIVGLAKQQQRQCHVLRHIQMRQHMKRLKHEADMLAALQRALVVGHRLQVRAVELHSAFVPAVEPGHAVE